MNERIPEAYREDIRTLALGVEPIDALRGLRVARKIAMLIDGTPYPPPNQSEGKGWHWFETTGKLPSVPRLRSGRYALLRPKKDPPKSVTIRMFEAGRHFVPRRLAIDLGPRGTAIVQPHLFPGAAYDCSQTATGLRGRVLIDPSTPLRWARIQARQPGTTFVVGRAHGDDRGEFVLLLGSRAAGVGQLGATIKLEVDVLGPAQPKQPMKGEAERDPLWDLPTEPIAAVPSPGILEGTTPPAGYGPLLTSSSFHGSTVATRIVWFVPGRLRTDEQPFFVSFNP